MSQHIQEAPFADSGELGAPESIAQSRFVVMKFGGTSLSTKAHWETITGLLRNRLDAGLRPVMVVAAVAKVTRELGAIVALAETGDPSAELAALGQRHLVLAESLGLDGAEILGDMLQSLDESIRAIRLAGEATPGMRAQTLASGELLVSAIGSAYLKGCGLDVSLLDARTVLQVTDEAARSPDQQYLFANCSYEPDPELGAAFERKASVILTQGFIAANARQETVLLGREGSDTSATCLAAMLGARRVEIWTDVPGIFSVDPRLLPSARLLTELRYDEAQELASSGTKVLHPRCLRPLRQFNIPLFIRSTEAPHIQGTTVAELASEGKPQVKGLSIQTDISLISLESASMWREAGFLARVFACFAAHNVSIDRVSTSESSVTVSTDVAGGQVSAEIPQALLSELEELGRVQLIQNCATVSVVGRKIRAVLSTIARALSIFEEERIHLVSQAANDLNFSFVIDQDQVPRLIGRLHDAVIRPGGTGFGPSWEELFRDEPAERKLAEPWWLTKRDRLLQIAAEHGNAFVYDLDSIRAAASGILGLQSVDRILYAMKANFNADVIRTLADVGVDFDCVSPGEFRRLREVVPHLDPQRVLFTPNFAPRSDYAWAFEENLLVTLDNLYPLRAWPELFAGRKVFVRLDPGVGHGHHEHVKTAGIHSKFGIPQFEVDELVRLLDDANALVIGIHAHIGSGILEPRTWREVAAQLTRIAARFPHADVIDLGGGFGVPEKTGDAQFDLDALDELLAEVRREFPQYRLWLEPGRYLVSQAGVLLSHVTQTKGKAEMRYVGIATGMNALIRPALYGAYHEIVNLTRVHEAATELVTVVGPICESGDKLGSDRFMPPATEGDVMLIANAGAYCRVMSSSYNLREVPPEISI